MMNAQTKHTPGPWEAAAREGDDWDSVVCVPNTPYEICQCFHDDDDKSECEANARLIAAAPELLEALEFTLRNLDAFIYEEYSGTSMLEEQLAVFDKARAVIAKATA